MKLTIDITNCYADETVESTQEVEVPEPWDRDDEDEMADWAAEHLLPFTGTGRSGDAGYFVEITKADDPTLVGLEWEWFG